LFIMGEKKKKPADTPQRREREETSPQLEGKTAIAKLNVPPRREGKRETLGTAGEREEAYAREEIGRHNKLDKRGKNAKMRDSDLGGAAIKRKERGESRAEAKVQPTQRRSTAEFTNGRLRCRKRGGKGPHCVLEGERKKNS